MTPFILIAVLTATPDAPVATADQVATSEPVATALHWYFGVGPRTSVPFKGDVGVAGDIVIRYRPITLLSFGLRYSSGTGAILTLGASARLYVPRTKGLFIDGEYSGMLLGAHASLFPSQAVSLSVGSEIFASPKVWVNLFAGVSVQFAAKDRTDTGVTPSAIFGFSSGFAGL